MISVFVEPQSVYEQRIKKQEEDRNREIFLRCESRLEFLEQIIVEMVEDAEGVPVREIWLANQMIKQLDVHGKKKREDLKIKTLSAISFLVKTGRLDRVNRRYVVISKDKSKFLEYVKDSPEKYSAFLAMKAKIEANIKNLPKPNLS